MSIERQNEKLFYLAEWTLIDNTVLSTISYCTEHGIVSYEVTI